jgi:phenylalanyl-tRNA synthetase alpha chain
MNDSAHRILSQWIERIESCSTRENLEEIRLRLLGKSGFLTHALKKLKEIPLEERAIHGAHLNQMRDILQEKMTQQKKVLDEAELRQKLQKESIDVTLPGYDRSLGTLHPITVFSHQIIRYFQQFGFECISGPDIETEWNNFDALNIPVHHPARQNHDTFYVNRDNFLLRTHTSCVQIRGCATRNAPIRLLSVGRTYRSDLPDSTHTPMFHQLEGLVIDQKIHMGFLKGTLLNFCRWFFCQPDLSIRFRPSFFPFTEPSAEVDVSYSRKGSKIQMGPGSNWLELGGCGMVHPQVLKNCGITNPSTQGFAFGIGVERLAMLKLNLSDIREFYEGDTRWIQHYGLQTGKLR